jgi:hypothetical protein
MTASISDLFEFCFGEEELPNDTSPPIARIAIGRDRLTMSVALAREDCHSEGAYVQALSAQLRECIILGYESIGRPLLAQRCVAIVRITIGYKPTDNEHRCSFRDWILM